MGYFIFIFFVFVFVLLFINVDIRRVIYCMFIWFILLGLMYLRYKKVDKEL